MKIMGLRIASLVNTVPPLEVSTGGSVALKWINRHRCFLIADEALVGSSSGSIDFEQFLQSFLKENRQTSGPSSDGLIGWVDGWLDGSIDPGIDESID